jgi:two-component system, OmpR family, KDP operon response regulator KdpE
MKARVRSLDSCCWFSPAISRVASHDRALSRGILMELSHAERRSSTGASKSRGRILVVDDEAQIRRVLRTTLIAGGYEVDDARGGQEALEKVRETKYDVILLDINMPDIKGTEVCRAIRSSSDVALIMLTVRNSEADKVMALDAGADDYVTKPFSTSELFARIRAVLRRNAADSAVQQLNLKDVEVNFLDRQVTVRGKKVHLTPKEFELLQYLANRPNKVVGHRELLRAIWGPDYGDELGHLRAYVKQLRKKIEAHPGKPKHLLTEPWVGYQLRVPE